MFRLERRLPAGGERPLLLDSVSRGWCPDNCSFWYGAQVSVSGAFSVSVDGTGKRDFGTPLPTIKSENPGTHFAPKTGQKPSKTAIFG